MKYSEKLKKQYSEEIESWNWESLISELNESEPFESDSGMHQEIYIGSVFSIFPSGKYYTFWTSNQTTKDELKDSIFSEMLENKLKSLGLYLTSGEGSPCDLFIGRTIE